MDNEIHEARPLEGELEDRVAEDGSVISTDERKGTLVFAAVLTLLGIFWVYASSDLPNRQQTAYLSQGFVPITAGIMLASLSAMLFISTWITKSAPPSALGLAPLFTRRGELIAAGTFATLLGYIILLPHVHYLISSFLLMTVGLALAGEPLKPRLLIIAAVMAGLFFLIFIIALEMPLPGSRFA